MHDEKAQEYFLRTAKTGSYLGLNWGLLTEAVGALLSYGCIHVCCEHACKSHTSCPMAYYSIVCTQ